MGKIATSISDQIQLLKDRGMNFDMDEDKVKEILLDIGYYRLGFYWFPFEIDKDHNFKEGTNFSTVVNLYYLDVDLRHFIIKYINRIEVSFRTKVVYYVSNKYKDSPTWFIDKKVMLPGFIKDFDKYYQSDYIKCSTVIKKHHKKYINDKYAPAWKTLEYFTFGTILTIYKSLIDEEIKLRISNIFGVKDVKKFTQLMSAIVFLRNNCAHSNVVFDLRNPYGLPSLPFYEFNNRDRHSLDSCLKILNFILSNVSTNRSDEFLRGIDHIFNEFKEDGKIRELIERSINYKFKE